MGGQIDPGTQKSHVYKDKARLVEVASDAADHVIEDQLETIRVHLASSTLADDVSWSPSTSVPGERIEHTGVNYLTGKRVAFCGIFFCLHRDIINRFFEPILADVEKLSPRDRLLLSDFLGDPRPAEKALRLDRQSIIFAICPNDSCHQIHKPTFNLDSSIPIYPKYCQGRHFGNPCEEELLRPKRVQGNVVSFPIKSFIYFDAKDWPGSQLSEPGLEAKMNAAWSQTRESKRSDTMRDIFDGEMLQNFKGPDGKHFGQEEDEGRYVFSLSIDFFNPLSNKESWKKVSVGIISLVCLSLPPKIHYRAEGMCLVGIIPGPHEPPLTTLKHFLTPLVDDFWSWCAI